MRIKVKILTKKKQKEIEEKLAESLFLSVNNLTFDDMKVFDKLVDNLADVSFYTGGFDSMDNVLDRFNEMCNKN